MTIEVALLISMLAVSASIYFGLSSKKRNEKNDTKKDAAEMTTVIIKLDNISTGVAEIKSELTNVKSDVKEVREKNIRMDESLKSAWKRIEELIIIIEKYKKNSVDTEE